MLRKMNASICLRKMGFISSPSGFWKQFMWLATIGANAIVEGQWMYIIKFLIICKNTSNRLRKNNMQRSLPLLARGELLRQLPLRPHSFLLDNSHAALITYDNPHTHTRHSPFLYRFGFLEISLWYRMRLIIFENFVLFMMNNECLLQRSLEGGVSSSKNLCSSISLQLRSFSFSPLQILK
jgi:hypothetical protein